MSAELMPSVRTTGATGMHIPRLVVRPAMTPRSTVIRENRSRQGTRPMRFGHWP